MFCVFFFGKKSGVFVVVDFLLLLIFLFASSQKNWREQLRDEIEYD